MENQGEHAQELREGGILAVRQPDQLPSGQAGVLPPFGLNAFGHRQLCLPIGSLLHEDPPFWELCGWVTPKPPVA